VRFMSFMHPVRTVNTCSLHNCDVSSFSNFHSNCTDRKKQRSRMRIQSNSATTRSRLALKFKLKHTCSAIQVEQSSITQYIIPCLNLKRAGKECTLHSQKIDLRTTQSSTVATKAHMSQAVKQRLNERGSQ
jgi:hypothetical protein